MPIISVRYNGKNTRKRNVKKKKRQKEQGGTKATVKWWKVNDFAVHLS